MSTIHSNQETWTKLADRQLDPKYEKCRNITEEIYKRINITFQIKKLETGEQSDVSVNSDQIDSNELSNETDLFACDKSDISSTEPEQQVRAPLLAPGNNNNNEERAKGVVYKRPRKRFRKRVKKRPPHRKHSDSEGSSDEAPLSRSLLILSHDLTPKSPEKKSLKKTIQSRNLTLRELLKPTELKVPTVLIEKIKSIDNEARIIETTDKKEQDKKVPVIDKLAIGTAIDKTDESIDKKDAEVTELSLVDKKKQKDLKITDWKHCTLCSSSFRGERGLRRHMTMSHLEENK